MTNLTHWIEPDDEGGDGYNVVTHATPPGARRIVAHSLLKDDAEFVASAFNARGAVDADLHAALVLFVRNYSRWQTTADLNRLDAQARGLLAVLVDPDQ